jgi:tetratricopeptide (TPR) repeat protein
MPYEYDPYLERYLKEYQDNPRSRIFAPLAEAYRKSGLVDEAIDICKEGLQYHPNFISGMVALARAYLDKGLYTATIRELEKVVSEAPDNYLAQKLLAQSYLLIGDNDNALKAYKMVIYINPTDAESKTVISKIESKNQNILDDNIDDIMNEIIEENQEDSPLLPFKDDEYDYKNNESNYQANEEKILSVETDFEEKKAGNVFRELKKEDEPEQILTNISTMTMGELLVSQGYKEKALEVYKKILEKNPEQILIKQKIEELEQDLGINFYDQKLSEKNDEDSSNESNNKDYSNLHDEDSPLTEENLNVNFIDQNQEAQDQPSSKDYLPDESEEYLDSEWIFNDPSENTTVLKLKAILNKVRLYRMSVRKNPNKA